MCLGFVELSAQTVEAVLSLVTTVLSGRTRHRLTLDEGMHLVGTGIVIVTELRNGDVVALGRR